MAIGIRSTSFATIKNDSSKALYISTFLSRLEYRGGFFNTPFLVYLGLMEIDHHSFEIRPRFKLLCSRSIEEITHGMQDQFRADKKIKGRIVNNHIYVNIPAEDLHYWSPELHITLHPQKQGTLVRGLVGPSPKIWTMFMFIYFGIGIIFLFGSIYGLSKYWLNGDTGWLWTIPACIFLFIITFIAAKSGQKIGREQTEQLKLPLRRVLALGTVEELA